MTVQPPYCYLLRIFLSKSQEAYFMRIFLRLVEIPRFQYQVANEELFDSIIVSALQDIL